MTPATTLPPSPALARRFLSLGILLALAACAPTPRLTVPPAILSDDWQGPVPAHAVALAQGDFWRAFGSPELSGLIARARSGNADLAAAIARVDRARAQLRQSRAALGPTGGIGTGMSGTKTDNTGAARFAYSDAYAQLDISYDLDLFGRLKADKRASAARATAALFDRDALQLVIETETARAYVRHAALVDRIAILDHAIAQARDLDRIVQIRVREGAATALDRGLNAIDLRTLEAERSRLIEGQARTRNALAVLVGEEAPRFQVGSIGIAAFGVPVPELVQPKMLLFRRPDLAGAEARIAAAHGDVDQARAAFMPSVRLSASGLAQAATLSGPVGLTAAAAASLFAPIFNRSRLTGELQAMSAAQRESVANYRATLLNAFREAQDALAAVEQASERQRLYADAARQSVTTTRIARIQYVEGQIDLQAALQADRGRSQAEAASVEARAELLEACIDLYKAFGGDPSFNR